MINLIRDIINYYGSISYFGAIGCFFYSLPVGWAIYLTVALTVVAFLGATEEKKEEIKEEKERKDFCEKLMAKKTNN
jgi:hypothetical protein